MVTFELDKLLTASAQELEKLSWYNLTTKLGLQSFNFQGNKSVEIIKENVNLTKDQTVLMVGCGAGATAVHLAEISGAMIYGIDIAVGSIAQAKELATKSPASDRLHFKIEDAQALTFEPNMFDLVITEFMAFFLRPEAFTGFFRVLKPGGAIALAELMKDPTVNPKADKKILGAEQIYSDLLGYKFHIPTISDYSGWLTASGFQKVEVKEKFPYPGFKLLLEVIGGWKNLWKIMKVILRLMHESPIITKKFKQQGIVKRIIYQNKSTAKFIAQRLIIGLKE